MIPVHFPPPDFRTKTEGGRRYIFDGIRKSWLVLTDEEWVRQNFVAYLLQQMNYPLQLLALEKEIVLNGLTKRFDILVYDKAYQPWMLVECKAAQISLTEPVLQQVLRYNISLPVDYLVITNGEQTVGWKKEAGALRLLEALPLML